MQPEHRRAAAGPGRLAQETYVLPGQGRTPKVPVRLLLVGVPQREQARLGEGAADELNRYWQVAVREAAGKRQRWQAEIVERPRRPSEAPDHAGDGAGIVDAGFRDGRNRLGEDRQMQHVDLGECGPDELDRKS